MICVRRKPTFCICENKEADQLRGNSKADQSLCFRYIGSTIPLLSNLKYQASTLTKMKRLLQGCSSVAATLQQSNMYATTGGDKVAN